MTLFDDIFCCSFTILDSPLTVCSRSGNFIRSSFIFDVVSTFCIIILSTVVCCRVGAALVSCLFFSRSHSLECHRFFVLWQNCIPSGVMSKWKTKSRPTKRKKFSFSLSLFLFFALFIYIFVHNAPRIKKTQYQTENWTNEKENETKFASRMQTVSLVCIAKRVTSLHATN